MEHETSSLKNILDSKNDAIKQMDALMDFLIQLVNYRFLWCKSVRKTYEILIKEVALEEVFLSII